MQRRINVLFPILPENKNILGRTGTKDLAIFPFQVFNVYIQKDLYMASVTRLRPHNHTKPTKTLRKGSGAEAAANGTAAVLLRARRFPSINLGRSGDGLVLWALILAEGRA